VGIGFPEDFYGFREVPFHIHLGMRFERPEPGGRAIVTLPASADICDADGLHSPAAVYTVGEVATGIEVCDALLLHAAEAETTLMPLVLTTISRFWQRGPARGDIHAETEFVGDTGAEAQKLRENRKTKVETRARLYGDGSTLAGEMQVFFYVRLMELSRLEAMAGTLMPAMAARAREALR
jgi:hypothetical protein